ncbi:MAG: hypothetical protein Q4F31_07270 [Eubacteriales bacterium]|nr:hypothetical protein [Eubacteriales bacterium]
MEDESKKKLVNTAVAAAAVTGVLVGGLFNSPADLAGESGSTAVDRTAPPPAIEMMAEEPEEDTGSGGTGELPSEGSPEEEEKNSSGGGGSGSGSSGAGEGPEAVSGSVAQTGNILRNAIMKLPKWVRSLVGVPLWCVGWLLISSASALWSAVLSPVLGAVSGWILTAALILITAAVAVKAAFPDLPLKKILNKRTLLGTLIGVTILALFNAVLPFFSESYERIATLVKILGSTAVLAVVLFPFFRKKKAAEVSAISKG